MHKRLGALFLLKKKRVFFVFFNKLIYGNLFDCQEKKRPNSVVLKTGKKLNLHL